MHLVFPGKEKPLGVRRSPVFRLDTPTPTPGPPQRAQGAQWGRGGLPTALLRRWVPSRESKITHRCRRQRRRPLPGTQPNLASLLWPQRLPRLANSGRTSPGCGRRRSGPLPSARPGGCQPRASLKDSAWGPRELRPNSPGLHSYPVVRHMETNPQSRSTLPSAWKAWD